VTVEPTATALSLRPVKIIFGANAPKLQVIQVAAPVTKKKNGGGGGGGGDAGSVSAGGGGGAPAPAPASNPPSTGSSKP
jgi:hypothetical protein